MDEVLLVRVTRYVNMLTMSQNILTMLKYYLKDKWTDKWLYVIKIVSSLTLIFLAIKYVNILVVNHIYVNSIFL